MSGYLSSKKLGNVLGRIDYISNEKRQENIVDYYNTTDIEFWELLAKECRFRHKESKAGGKCCESRELIIGIPQNLNITSQEICEQFKNKYKVECACAIHLKTETGTLNKHCHLIFSERQKLATPEITEEKRAVRTYYYDKSGKKCKKADAVKTVAKGTVLQKSTQRLFSDKNDYFKTQQFVYDCKETFLKKLFQIDWSIEAEMRDKFLSEKHIGKNNPKEEFIRENNKLKSMLKNVCSASDFLLETKPGQSLIDFKQDYNIKSMSTNDYEINKLKVNNFIESMQGIYSSKLNDTIYYHNDLNNDIDFYGTSPNNYYLTEKYINDVPASKEKSFIELLKSKLHSLFERINKLVHLQKKFYISKEDSFEMQQDKYNNIHLFYPYQREREEELIRVRKKHRDYER